jgi:hypothetical protein
MDTKQGKQKGLNVRARETGTDVLTDVIMGKLELSMIGREHTLICFGRR